MRTTLSHSALTHSQPPLQLRLDQPYAATPAATALTAEEIAARFADGHDPWAEEWGTSCNNRLVRPPMQSMLTAARFAALFTDADTVAAITARRACTLITVSSAVNPRTLQEEINATLDWLADIAEPSWDAWRGFGVVALDTDSMQLSSRQQNNQT